MASSLLAPRLLSLTLVTLLSGVLVALAGDTLVQRAQVPALRPYLWLLPIGLAGAGAFRPLLLGDPAARFRPDRAGQGEPGSRSGRGPDRARRHRGRCTRPARGRRDRPCGRRRGVTLQALRDRAFADVTRASLIESAARYRRFPMLLTWSGLLNVGGLQLPSILFAAGFGAAAAGLYALSYKVLVLPTMLVAQAVGQVFLSRAAALAGEPARLRALSERTALALFAGGLPAFCAVAIAARGVRPRHGPPVGASRAVRPGARSVVRPVAGEQPAERALNVREWQGSALAFTAVEFVLRLGSLLIGMHRGSMLAVALLSVSGIAIAAASTPGSCTRVTAPSAA